MLLAIDIGNSTIYFGGIENAEVKKTFRVRTEKKQIADEYVILIKELLKINFDINKINGVIISSVVPEITEEIERAIYKILNIKSVVVKRDIHAPFAIISESLADLGADLIANTTGAISKYKLPIIAFDMGTATTCTVVNRNGEFCGGMICPGLKTGAKALIDSASQLGEFSLGNPKEAIGTRTPECINAGVIYGHSAMIDGLRKRVEEETGEEYTVVLTGGNSDYVVQYIGKDIIQDKNLIFYGLNELYNKYLQKNV